ncbi:16S rRNA (guanine(527)-N(7))-methyltransferase [hydrothermal vent metagenome]|uniref:16S rRNA (Guanine(527)-N(7))-methyltransferase n=1 Tax=hydrothermal vent metagenome TaxID=652676 RepID=A0A3B1BRY3_9ZZZZ
MTESDINSACRQSLASGIAGLKLEVTSEQQGLLLRYITLLHHWNRAFNLTAVRGLAEMVPRHLLDSLAVSPYLHGSNILDVGTGPGLPGIPLAIIYPEMHFTLLDSNGKKIRFVRQAVMELGLPNIQTEQVRVEAFDPPQPFDTIVTRAFAALSETLALTSHLQAPGGRLVAMKSRQIQEELGATDLVGLAFDLIPLQVPQLDRERHVVLLDW